MPDQDGKWYQHLLTLWAILFYKSYTKGTNFWVIVIYIVCIYCNVSIFYLCVCCFWGFVFVLLSQS